MAEHSDYSDEVSKSIGLAAKDRDFLELSNIWLREASRYNYAHNFSWLGRPILQIPQDIYAIHEIVWNVKPDLIIETGIAHGGSLILSASMLALLDYCEAVESGQMLNPPKSLRRVLGIDIEIRPHNREAIEAHSLAHLIELIEGSSTNEKVVNEVRNRAQEFKNILVFLDSNHTHDHVLGELEAYAPLATVGSYCVVWDTGIEDLPVDFCADRPWGKGNNPKTAVWEYLRRLNGEQRKGADGAPLRFETDKVIERKLVVTASSDGFLKRVP